MRLIPPDAKGFEKFVYVFAEVFCPALILIMILSAFNILHNDYSVQCASATPKLLWKGLGVLFLLGSGSLFYAMKEDKIEATRGSIFGMVALLALSFLSFAGFYS